jgi:hypothetical protein
MKSSPFSLGISMSNRMSRLPGHYQFNGLEGVFRHACHPDKGYVPEVFLQPLSRHRFVINYDSIRAS